MKIGVPVIIGLLILGGIGFVVLKKAPSNIPSTIQGTTGGPGNVFTSIKDALSKSLTLECSFTDDQGRQTKSYIKNGAVRADFTASDPKESGSAIMKQNKLYFWNKEGGFVMDMSATETPAAGGGKTQAPEAPINAGDVLNELEKNKASCKPSVVNDSFFTPPSTVTFQDFSQLMKQVPGSLNAIPSGIPPIDTNQ